MLKRANCLYVGLEESIKIDAEPLEKVLCYSTNKFTKYNSESNTRCTTE